MRKLVFVLLLLACTSSPSWAAELKLSIRDGLVTLDAQEVTVRQILTEWARIGRTQIVNLERIAGGPITLKLEGVPEKQALDVILRSVPGYMAVPRQTLVADASVYDRILVMPTTTAVAAVRAQQPSPVLSGAPAQPFGGQRSNLTQLRPPAQLSPGTLPEEDPAQDQIDDPAIAAAAAAGLIAAPALNPGPSPIASPLTMPGAPQSAQPAQAPSAPSNPWNAPTGTSQPSLAPPVAVAPAAPTTRLRPPQPDR